MTNSNWITGVPRSWGFKVFRSNQLITFIYCYWDPDTQKWLEGLKIAIPTELGVKILKDEILNPKSEDAGHG